MDRVRQAVAFGAPKRPIPCACLWARIALDRWDGTGDEGAVTFADEPDRAEAMAELTATLAEAIPQEWGGLTLQGCERWGVCWKPHGWLTRPRTNVDL